MPHFRTVQVLVLIQRTQNPVTNNHNYSKFGKKEWWFKHDNEYKGLQFLFKMEENRNPFKCNYPVIAHVRCNTIQLMTYSCRHNYCFISAQIGVANSQSDSRIIVLIVTYMNTVCSETLLSRHPLLSGHQLASQNFLPVFTVNLTCIQGTWTPKLGHFVTWK